jgi:hypothetical protein
MMGESELEEYLAEIREQVCSCCPERPHGGPPCLPLGKKCGVELHLPRIIEVVRGTDKSGSLGPYLEHVRTQICTYCENLHTQWCPCPMDSLALLVVEAVETVDQRHAIAIGS